MSSRNVPSFQPANGLHTIRTKYVLDYCTDPYIKVIHPSHPQLRTGARVITGAVPQSIRSFWENISTLPVPALLSLPWLNHNAPHHCQLTGGTREPACQSCQHDCAPGHHQAPVPSLSLTQSRMSVHPWWRGSVGPWVHQERWAERILVDLRPTRKIAISERTHAHGESFRARDAVDVRLTRCMS